jgi:hypothetical protein
MSIKNNHITHETRECAQVYRETISDLMTHLLLMTEEVGAIATHLREARQDVATWNLEGCGMSLESLMETAGTIEAEANRMQTLVARLS